MPHPFHPAETDDADDTARWAGERRRKRRAHRRRHGGRSKGRRHHVDWDDVTSLENHQRDLEQREADIRARIEKVRRRIVSLSEG